MKNVTRIIQLSVCFVCMLLLNFNVWSQDTVSVTGHESLFEGFALWDTQGNCDEAVKSGHPLDPNLKSYANAHYYFATRDFGMAGNEVDPMSEAGMHMHFPKSGFTALMNAIGASSFSLDSVNISFGLTSLGADVEGVDWGINGDSEWRVYRPEGLSEVRIMAGGEVLLSAPMPDWHMDIQYFSNNNPVDDQYVIYAAHSILFDKQYYMGGELEMITDSLLKDIGSFGLHFSFGMVNGAAGTPGFSNSCRSGIYLDLQGVVSKGDQVICNLSGEVYFDAFPNNCSEFNIDGHTMVDMYVSDPTKTVKWNLGDGTILYDTNMFNHTYAPGGYAVKLTISDVDDSLCYMQKVDSVYSVNPVVASFNTNINLSRVDFDGSVSTGGSGQYKFNWDFTNDMGLDIWDVNPVQYVYGSTGWFEARVEVQDLKNMQCTDEFIDSIYIAAIDSCPITASISGTHMSKAGCVENFNVYLNGAGTYLLKLDMGNGVIIDDSSAGDYYFNYSYPSPGNYTVTVTARDMSDTTCQVTNNTFNINVAPPITYYFDAYSIGGYGYQFHAYVTGTGNFNISQWSFGDNIYHYSGVNVNHYYDGPGSYEVCMTVDDYEGCQKIYCDTIQVVNCYSDFWFENDSTDTLKVHFHDQSSVNMNQWTWAFDDGSFAYTQNPSHTYAAEGSYHVCLTAEDTVTSCVKNTCYQVHLGAYGNCFADFSFVPDTAGGLGVFFTDNSSAGMTSWYWNFGDGNSAYQPNPYHVYPYAGEFYVCLSVGDGSGCYPPQFCQNVYVGGEQLCWSNFTFNPDSAGLNVQFYNTSSIGITSMSWSFGDGNYSSEENPLHAYPYEGQFEVCLQVQDDSTSCFDNHCEFVYLGGSQNCQSSFGFHKDTVGFGVSFNNYSSGNIHMQNWNFGDGTYSNTWSPYHVFPYEGDFWVCLNIEDTLLDCMNNFCEWVHIGAAQPCRSDFTFYADSGLGVQFNNLSNANSGMHFNWSFGDGTSSQQVNPFHAFPHDGNFYVCLNLTTDSGCVGNFCEDVWIGGAQTCQANFNFIPDTAGMGVLFNNTSSGNFSIVNWNFGDGTYAAVNSPYHAFPYEGEFWVCLYIEDPGQCSNNFCDWVHIGQSKPCRADFGFVNDSAGHGVQFNNWSTANSTLAYNWNFGDGTSASQTSPYHVFPYGGSYNVCLNVLSDSGCADNLCLTVWVGGAQQCTADWIFVPDSMGSGVKFNNMSSSNIDNWYWSFGDGTYSQSPNPYHVYPYDGNFWVCLDVEDVETACMMNACNMIIVGAAKPCRADFGFIPDSSGAGVQFMNWSTANSGMHYNWTFGDGGYSSQSNPSHVFPYSGSFNVCLNLQTDSGCVDDFCTNIWVGGTQNCSADYSFFQDSLNNLIVRFSNKSSDNIDFYQWYFDDGTSSAQKNPVHTFPYEGDFWVCLDVEDTATGCMNYHCDWVHAGAAQQCKADFGWVPDTAGNGMQFNNWSFANSPIANYWTFGDGTSSSAASPYHVFPYGGNYEVCLNILSDSGCSGNFCTSIWVGGTLDCQAKFNFVPDTAGLGVKFNNTSSTNTNRYHWMFGDGTMSTSKSPHHTFPYEGEFWVCLDAEDTLTGCFRNFCKYVTVGEAKQCRASFGFNLDSVGSGVQFNNWSTAMSSKTYQWTFGDGTGSTQANPYHVYAFAGEYAVCLSMVTGLGCTDNYCTNIYVGATQQCFADFSYQVTCDTCLEVKLTNLSSTNTNVFDWSFGDGTFATKKSPTKVYAYPGDFNICLYAGDTLTGCGAPICKMVHVGAIQQCFADFHFVPDTAGSGVQFENWSSPNTNKHKWTFGDGTSSTKKTPYHVFPYAGSFNVCLISEDTIEDCRADFCMPIYVGAAQQCFADFNFVPDTAGFGVKFNNASSANANKYTWNFGDGANSASKDPYHVFPYGSEFNVCLGVEDNVTGCISNICKMVYVGGTQECFSSFYFFVDSVGLAVQFDNESSPNTNWYNWEFGDGTFSVKANPSHVFPYAGMFNVCLNASDTVTGCMARYCMPVFIGEAQGCYADFVFTPDSAGVNVQFNNTSSSNVDEYYWRFGDGTYSVKANPLHAFPYAGKFMVCMDVKDHATNCISTKCEEVFVGDARSCFADYYFIPDSVGLGVKFYSMSSSNITASSWSFDDGTYANQGSPYHVFPYAGLFYVCLNVTDANTGCVDQVCQEVVVGETINCSADFTFVIDTVGRGVQFTNKSSANVTNSYWNFDDGSFGSQKNPSHTYAYDGSFIVCLDVEDTVGVCHNYACKEVFIAKAVSCVADFAWAADSTGMTVKFTNKSSVNTNKTRWEFGNGATSSTKNPTYTYTKNGVYNVCLVAIDSVGGCQQKVCKQLKIGSDILLADFTFSIKDSTNTVSFKGTSIGTVVSKFWNFGDGKTQTGLLPSHQYAKAGVYKACLIVSDNNGKQSEKCKDVKIGSSLITADFSAFVDDDKNTVYFTDLSTGSVNNWYWTMGNGQTSKVKSPTQLYSKAGVKNVCLTAKDTVSGKQAQVCKEVQIGSDLAIAKFSFIVGDTNTVEFSDASTGSLSSWYWSFANGKTSTKRNPTHQFTQSGVYNVCLTVRDTATGRQSTTCKDVTIGDDLMIAKFTYFVDNTTKTLFVTDASIGSPTNYSWKFGDGSAATTEDAQHTYANAKDYEVCLSIFNFITGKQSKACHKIAIAGVACKAEFDYYVDSTNTVYFSDASQGDNTSWYWTLGDGDIATGEEVTHQYTLPNSYEVCLYTYDAGSGCTSSKCKEVIILGAECNLKASFNSFVIDSTNTVKLSDLSTGGANRWYWTFGDGHTAVRQTPQYKYKKPGFYLITLGVKDTVTGCASHYADFLQVGSANCVADFDYSVDASKLEVTLENNSIGNIANSFWLFGDNEFSKEAEPVHVYKKAGKYKIGLTVKDVGGLCVNHKVKEVQVGTVNCNASFTTFVDSSENRVHFKNGVLGVSTNLYWEFGDGSVSTLPNPVHRYKAPGYYLVTLNTFNNANGCMDVYDELILVGSKGQDCEADFLFQTDVATNTVEFFDNSSADTVTTYLWDFGQGDTAATSDASWTYLAEDYYMVCLTIRDKVNGCRNTHCENIKVGDGTNFCMAEYVYSADSTTREVAFVDRSNGDADEWNWSFGDGTASIEQDPIHAYTDTGYYIVRLSVKNSVTGCEADYYDIVNIAAGNNGMKAGFGFIQDTANTSKGVFPVDFKGAAFGDPAEFEWDFGDGETNSSSMSPSHTYDAAGYYDVCLVIADSVIDEYDEYCETILVSDEVVRVVDRSFGQVELVNYPNPMRDYTLIRYALPATMKVSLDVYDMSGAKVATLVDEEKSVGRHSHRWYANGVGTGIYYLQMRTQQGALTNKLVILE